MKVIIAGESPLVEEAAEFCIQAGHDTTMYLVEDFLSAIQSGFVLEGTDVDVVIEVHNGAPAGQQELSRALGRAIWPKTLVLTLCIATSTTQ